MFVHDWPRCECLDQNDNLIWNRRHGVERRVWHTASVAPTRG